MFSLLLSFSLALAASPRDGWMESKLHSEAAVLDLVREAPNGRAVLGALAPFLESGKLRIVSLRTTADCRLAESGVAGWYSQGRIGLDFNGPLLLVAGVLLHELVHAADYLANAEGRDLERESQGEGRSRVLLKTEHHAYQEWNAFNRSLIEKEPRVAGWLADLVEQKALVDFPMGYFGFEYLMRHPDFGGLEKKEVRLFLETHPF